MKQMISVFCLMMAAFAAAQSVSGPASTNLSAVSQTIIDANKAIADNPTQYEAYNLLATALIRRAQETSDVTFYARAEQALKKSLEIAPNNFDTEKIQVAILLAEQEYPLALETAKTLNKGVPDDVTVYGFLTDANVELGNYKDAEIAAQWMLDLRPGNLPALPRAGHLRELFGDTEGACELMDLAYQSTPPNETAERAWILTQMGHLRFATGATDTAEKLLLQALTTSPGYPLALANLAQVRITQKRYAEAVTLLQQLYQTVPRAGNLYPLAEALQLAGRYAEAHRVFADFENKAVLETNSKDNSNRELVFYYADHAQQPAKALEVAQREYAWRHDLYTLDAYAWALHVNSRDAEARKQIESALAVGIRDSEIFIHAGEIALKLGDRAVAQNYLREAVALHAVQSEHAELVLAQLSEQTEQR
jgi:tetratricopeptide (TPR) repeat protein